MKERILDVATRQMKRGGYASLNFADIASELDVSRTNLHHHFKNKEGLAVATTERYVKSEKSIFDRVLSENDGDLRAILQAFEKHLLEVAVAGYQSACICSQLLYETGAPASLRHLAAERRRDEIDSMAVQVRKAQKSGTLEDPRNAKDIAFQIMSTMLGIGQLTLSEPNPSKLARKIKGALTSLCGFEP